MTDTKTCECLEALGRGAGDHRVCRDGTIKNRVYGATRVTWLSEGACGCDCHES